MVEGIGRLLRHGGPDPVNIGNPTEHSLLELARLIIDLTGSASGIVHQPLPADDPRVRQPDISLATRTLGWRPSVDLRTGLAETIGYFRARLAVDMGVPA
jgi:nucleoside-diphosphate-sugar epimerase